jgi:hypothetical protein
MSYTQLTLRNKEGSKGGTEEGEGRVIAPRLPSLPPSPLMLLTSSLLHLYSVFGNPGIPSTSATAVVNILAEWSSVGVSRLKLHYTVFLEWSR